MTEITITVLGELPPAKNEALSMLGAGHSQAKRVRALLEAAADAIKNQSFSTITEGVVGLELIVDVPKGSVPDATNMLGGVGDVLEDKGHRGSFDHLGDLRHVAVYRNDSQVREVHYRERHSDTAGYMVRIWLLEVQGGNGGKG